MASIHTVRDSFPQTRQMYGVGQSLSFRYPISFMCLLLRLNHQRIPQLSPLDAATRTALCIQLIAGAMLGVEVKYPGEIHTIAIPVTLTVCEADSGPIAWM